MRINWSPPTKISQDLLNVSGNIDLAQWPDTVGKGSLLQAIREHSSKGEEQKRIQLATLKAIELGRISEKYLDEYRELLLSGKYPKYDKKFRRTLYENHGLSGCDPTVLDSTNIEEIMRLLKEALARDNARIMMYYLHHEGFIDEYSHEEEKKFREAMVQGNPLPRKKTWAEMAGIPLNQVVFAKHSGGWMFLQDFLLGNEIGYRLQIPGFGIQVHPQIEDTICGRDAYYAHGSARGHFDYPANLGFQIEAQYLEACRHGKGEAGFRLDCLPHAGNFRLANFETSEVIEATTLGELREKIAQSISSEGNKSIQNTPTINPFTVAKGNNI